MLMGVLAIVLIIGVVPIVKLVVLQINRVITGAGGTMISVHVSVYLHGIRNQIVANVKN